MERKKNIHFPEIVNEECSEVGSLQAGSEVTEGWLRLWELYKDVK